MAATTRIEPSRRARARRASFEFGHAEVFAAIFAVGFLVARFLPVLDVRYVCPFKALTGLPCATCGMTHAFVDLAHGAVRAAFGASPLGALVAAGSWAFVLVDAVRLIGAKPLPRIGPRAGRVLACAGLLALVANWAFLVMAGA